jgi:LysM repeat protein
MSYMTSEQEPGVYVRGNHAEQELDFLWNAEGKKPVERDRFHLGFFAGGALFGSVVTFLVCMFIFGLGKTTTAPTTLEKPTVVEEQVVIPEQTLPTPTAQTKHEAPKFGLFNFLPHPAPKAAETSKTVTAPSTADTRSYKVHSGDTLGSIAIHFYGTSSPKMIEKIQHANNMTNADQIKIDQPLVIPAS